MSGRTLTIEGAMTPEDIRRELSRRCEKRGQQGAFARRVGIPQSTISEVIANRRPVNAQIANALGFVVPAFFIPARGLQ
jgi:plasmid maintenance system antidote protein VapI